jgi:hypothetical protein
MSYQSRGSVSADIDKLNRGSSTFASEGVDDLFLDTLFTLRETLIL